MGRRPLFQNTIIDCNQKAKLLKQGINTSIVIRKPQKSQVPTKAWKIHSMQRVNGFFHQNPALFSIDNIIF